jgi:hypothetical protein
MAKTTRKRASTKRSREGKRDLVRRPKLAENATVGMARKSPARRGRSASLERLAPFEDDCVLVIIETPKGSPNNARV